MKRKRAGALSGEALIVLVLGGIFLVIGLVLAVFLPRVLFGRMDAFNRASGRVIAMVESPGEDDAEFRRPVVDFEAPNGELYRFTSSYASNPPAYATGDMVAVRYDPANPHDAEIESATGAEVGILRLLGVIFALVGLAIYGVAALMKYLLGGNVERVR